MSLFGNPSLFGGPLSKFNFEDLSPELEPEPGASAILHSQDALNVKPIHVETESMEIDSAEDGQADASPPQQDLFPRLNSASPSPDTFFDFSTEPRIPAPEYANLTALTALTSNASNITRSLQGLSVFFNRQRRAAAQGPLKGGASGWIDQDDSGTYDPAQKLKRLTHAKVKAGARRAKRKQELVSDTDDDNDNEESEDRYSRKNVGYGLMMTFSFVKPASKSYLRSITPSFSEEEVSSQSDSEEDSSFSGPFEKAKKLRNRKKRKYQDTSARPDRLTIEDLTPAHPQIQGCKSCFNATNDECTLITDPRNYPCEACTDTGCECILIIPPLLKKICERCKKKRRECSYKGDGGRGQEACIYCLGEELECPAAPLELESAYGRRFKTEEEKSESKGSNPKRTKSKKSTAEITNLDSDEQPKERDRLYKSCNQCRHNGPDNTRCNVSWESTGPCRNCIKNNENCQFVLKPKPRPEGVPSLLNQHPYISSSTSHGRKVSGKKGKGKPSRAGRPETPGFNRRTANAHSPGSTTAQLGVEIGRRFSKGSWRAQANSLMEGPAAGFIQIITAFCHPISFNWEIPPTPIQSPAGLSARERSELAERDRVREKQCNFCDTSYPPFGLYGLSEESGPRKVEGYYPDDGQGFQEMSGGFSELGQQQTRMCIACTTARLNIISCSQHFLTPFTSIEQNPLVFNEAAFYDVLIKMCTLTPKLSSTQLTTDFDLVLNAKFCSVCPDLAVYKCNSKKSFHENQEGDMQHGCGLNLCENCGNWMNKILRSGEQLMRNGVRETALDRLISEASKNDYLYANGVRADASLLTNGGELVVRMRQMALAEDKINNPQNYLPPEGETSDREDWLVNLDIGVGKEGKKKRERQPKTTFSPTNKQILQEPPQPPTQEPKKDKGKGKDWSYFSPSRRPSEFHTSSSHNNLTSSFNSPFTKKVKPAHKVSTYGSNTYSNPYATAINTLSYSTSKVAVNSIAQDNDPPKAKDLNAAFDIRTSSNTGTAIHASKTQRRTTSSLLQPGLQKTQKASSFQEFADTSTGNGESMFGPSTSARTQNVGLGIGMSGAMNEGARERADSESGAEVVKKMFPRGAIIDLTASDDDE